MVFGVTEEREAKDRVKERPGRSTLGVQRLHCSGGSADPHAKATIATVSCGAKDFIRVPRRVSMLASPFT